MSTDDRVGAPSENAEIAKKKSEMRLKMKRLRASAPDRAMQDEKLASALLSLSEVEAAKRIFLYYSVRDEADTHLAIGALLKRGKEVYLPRTEGKKMVAVRYAGDGLCCGQFGIPEPCGEILRNAPDICVLPLLAADKHFRRLGYGGGYYDRFLSEAGSQMLRIGLCYDFQIEEEVPSEAHDALLDIIVTDARVLVRDRRR